MANPFTILRPNSDPSSGMGANLLPAGGTAFRVWAPNASAVFVRLRHSDNDDFTDLPLSADPSNASYFSADVSGAVTDDQYRFLITNNHIGVDNPGGVFERVDPYGREVETADAAAPAYVSSPAFPFSPFKSPWFEDYLIYQLHLGSFAGLNDGLAVVNRVATFRQIATAKLDYIASLNFNAVAFLPTTQNPPKEPEGYAPMNFFAPDSDYGSPADLRFLVDECHKRGLAVIIDVVYNHVVADDQFDRLLRFDGNTVNNQRGIYLSSADNFGPVPDFDRPEVMSFFTDNIRQCFNEFNADALRSDSAHAINGILHGYNSVQDLVGSAKAEFPGKFLIAEHNNPSFAINTLGFDSSWQMNSVGTFIWVINFGSVGDLESLVTTNLRHGFNRVCYLLGSHDEIYANYSSYNGAITTDKPDNRYFVEKVGGVIVGRDDWTARAKARLGWALNVMMPCTPMLFMGSEVHHHGYWNAMLDANPGDHRFDFSLTTDDIGKDMTAMVSAVNGFRWNHSALRSDNIQITHRDATNRVLGFKRWNEQGDVLLVVVNLSGNQFDQPTYGVTTDGQPGNWQEAFNSQAPDYGGFENSGNFGTSLPVDSNGQIFIRLPGWSVLVFSKL